MGIASLNPSYALFLWERFYRDGSLTLRLSR